MDEGTRVIAPKGDGARNSKKWGCNKEPQKRAPQKCARVSYPFIVSAVQFRIRGTYTNYMLAAKWKRAGQVFNGRELP